ncbi:MAG: hypothetical protein V4714_08455 [Bacteroidota bacterium]
MIRFIPPRKSLVYYQAICRQLSVFFLLFGTISSFASTTFVKLPDLYTHPSPTDSNRMTKEVYYYGKEGKQHPQIPLVAGPLHMIYEDGNLRYIRLGQQEVIRMIYPAVRDRDWATILPRLTHEKIDKKANSFHISYENHYSQGDIQYVFRCTLEGKSDGTIRYEVEGEALSTFQKNRIGICVLHPIKEIAGKSCEIIQPNGEKYTSNFPLYIHPITPFKNIQAMRWEAAAQCTATLTFAGEIFETEDQRNYADASYKTYSTPSGLPRPVEVKKGDRIQQSVELKLSGTIPKTFQDWPLQFNITTQETFALPAIGVSQSSEASGLSTQEIQRIKDLKLAHYRINVVPAQPGWEAKLHTAILEAKQLGLPMEVMLYAGNNPEADAAAFLRECPSERTTVKSVTVFHPGKLEAVSRILKEGYPNTPIGTGVNSNFVEMNEHRPSLAGAEFLSYAVNPQIHLFENATIVENLAGQAYTVESAKKIANGLPVYISAVTLRPHPYPVDKLFTGDQLPSSSDVRQMSLFGAAYTVGSVKALAESGAGSTTYYETVGTQGLMQAEKALIAPAVFKAPEGALYPLYYVLQSIGAFGATQVVKSTSTQPLVVDGLVLSKGKAKRLLLVNYTGQPQSIRVGSLVGTATLRILDETNVAQAMQQPEAFAKRAATPLSLADGYTTVALKPYATIIIDVKE